MRLDAACAALKQLRLGSECQITPSKAASTAVSTVGTENASTGVIPAPSATLLGHTFVLQRKDIPSVLQQLGATCSISKQEQTDTMKNHTAEPTPADVAVTVTVAAGAVTPSMLQALVIGDWCTQGAQVLTFPATSLVHTASCSLTLLARNLGARVAFFTLTAVSYSSHAGILMLSLP